MVTDDQLQSHNPRPDSNDCVSEEDFRVERGRKLAFLSLAVYLLGFAVVFAIAIGDTGLQAISNAVGITFICLTLSFVLAIAASMTYPRALAMLLVHIATIALLVYAN